MDLALVKWFSERPNWVRIALQKLNDGTMNLEKDIPIFAKACLDESSGVLNNVPMPELLSFPTGTASSNLRLLSIEGVEGVNALAPKAPLVFNENGITIVYGSNGSGKSGYVRLLKHLCNARYPGQLLGNVFEQVKTIPKATIKYRLGNQESTVSWTNDKAIADLCEIDIFDASYGQVFVSKEDELRYEPPPLSLFSALVALCDEVDKCLVARKEKMPSNKPVLPSEYEHTDQANWYNSFDHKTTSEAVAQQCGFTDADNLELDNLIQRVAEKSPVEKAKQLRTQKHYLDSIIQDTMRLLNQHSTENYQKILNAKSILRQKQTASEIATNLAFSGSVLSGIGTDVWKELWEAARKYSIDMAYKDSKYPKVSSGARCVLCHQILDDEAQRRLTSFEDFVKNDLQQAVTVAQDEYNAALQTIEAVPDDATLTTTIAAAGIQDDVLVSQIKETFLYLQSLKDQLPQLESEPAVSLPLKHPEWITQAGSISESHQKSADNFENDAQSDNSEERKRRLRTLQAKKWLAINRVGIEEEIERQKQLHCIDEAKKLTSTKALSSKKGELSSELLTEAFVNRFQTELKALGAGKLRVELVKSRSDKGRILHKIQLRGAEGSKVLDILSEGESRIVAIAAFLADVTGRSDTAPFIFDDPISSLDQLFEEAVVMRLVELAEQRQIIIFTHRLSLVGLMKEKEKNLNVICLRQELWGTGEPGELPISSKNTKAAINTLLIDRLQRLRNTLQQDGTQEYEIQAKSFCSDVRDLIEKCIEDDLLLGIIQRFRRAVHTQKLPYLKKLKESDCTFLDGMMSKYSGLVHSQPTETPLIMPEPNEFKADLDSLTAWRGEYSQRNP